MDFTKKVYKITKKIPKGKITTYKLIANKLNTKAYRAVGTILKNNNNPEIPCHRVVKSNKKPGNYNKGKKEKIRLLKKEGIKIKNNKILDFKEKLFRP